jgi:hypothetical protein
MAEYDVIMTEQAWKAKPGYFKWNYEFNNQNCVICLWLSEWYFITFGNVLLKLSSGSSTCKVEHSALASLVKDSHKQYYICIYVCVYVIYRLLAKSLPCFVRVIMCMSYWKSNYSRPILKIHFDIHSLCSRVLQLSFRYWIKVKWMQLGESCWNYTTWHFSLRSLITKFFDFF